MSLDCFLSLALEDDLLDVEGGTEGKGLPCHVRYGSSLLSFLALLQLLLLLVLMQKRGAGMKTTFLDLEEGLDGGETEGVLSFGDCCSHRPCRGGGGGGEGEREGGREGWFADKGEGGGMADRGSNDRAGFAGVGGERGRQGRREGGQGG